MALLTKFFQVPNMIADGLNTFSVILIYGSLILLSFITVVNPLKVNIKANYWFGTFLFLWSLFWLDEITQFAGSYTAITGFSVLFDFIRYFTPIVFYLSIVNFTNPNYRFRAVDLKYLLLPLLYLVLLIWQIEPGNENQRLLQFLNLGFVLLQVILYTFLSYLRIRSHQKKIQVFVSNTAEIDLSWLEYIITSIVLLSAVVVLYNVFFISSQLNVFINGFFIFIIYFVAYNTLKQKEIYPLDKDLRKEIILIEEEQSGEPKRKIVPDSDLIKLKSRLSEVMTVQKPYLDCEINLIKLAELCNMTPHQLSYIINTGYNENFFQFINAYRVERAKELLVKAEMNKLSILGIAFESGFNSKTSFNTTFKKITGQTPSEFKKKSSEL